MSKHWITWEEYSKGYTIEDHLAHALRGTLPTIDRKSATYEQLKECFVEKIAERQEINAMRKSKKKEKAMSNWVWSFTCCVFSSMSTGNS